MKGKKGNQKILIKYVRIRWKLICDVDRWPHHSLMNKHALSQHLFLERTSPELTFTRILY